MALVNKTVLIGNNWTLVTNKNALLQFNDEIFMALTFDNVAPTETVGFTFKPGDFFVNPILNSHVWAKRKLDGTNIESVRVVEN